jgi:hypothetical protein
MFEFNYDSTDYENEVAEFQAQHRSLMSGWGLAVGLEFNFLTQHQ